MNIAELRRLEAEATPGPWKTDGTFIENKTHIVATSYHPENCERDAALIVAMRNALLELLKALETLQQIESTAWDGLEDGGYREALIEIRYAARKALPPHGGVDV